VDTAFVPASAITKMAERVDGDRERNGARLRVHGRLGGQAPAEADAEHVDVVAVALRGDDELGAVRVKATCPGVVVNCGVAFGSRPREFPLPRSGLDAGGRSL
jgi:hypothetical protein